MDYKKVIEDIREGVIDTGKWVVVFDNDGGYWRYDGDDYDDLSDELLESMEAVMNKEYGKPDGYGDIVDLAIAAGIPAEWC